MNLGLTLALGLMPTSGGGADPTTLEQLIAAVNAGGGFSSVHDFTQATNTGTWTSEDLSANNRDFTQGTAAAQPGISGTLGATLDGSDALDQTISGGTFTIVASVTKSDASTDGVIISDQGGAILVRYTVPTNTVTHPGTVTVNGVATPDRDDLYTALHTTGERLLKVAGLDMTGDTALRIGGRPATGLLGSIRRIVVLEHGTMGAGLAAAVALAESWVVAA